MANILATAQLNMGYGESAYDRVQIEMLTSGRWKGYMRYSGGGYLSTNRYRWTMPQDVERMKRRVEKDARFVRWIEEA